MKVSRFSRSSELLLRRMVRESLAIDDLLEHWGIPGGTGLLEDLAQRKKDGVVASDFEPPITQSGLELMKNEKSWEVRFKEAVKASGGDMEAAAKRMPPGRDGKPLSVRTLYRQAYKALGHDEVLDFLEKVRGEKREEEEGEGEERKK